MDKVRAHIIVSGMVQGVFFRYTMKQVASRYNACGWVKNLPEGQVEAVLEGNPSDVKEIIEWARQGPSGAVVKDIEVKWENYSGEFRDFSIKYF
jgi:acylphosphatase